MPSAVAVTAGAADLTAAEDSPADMVLAAAERFAAEAEGFPGVELSGAVLAEAHSVAAAATDVDTVVIAEDTVAIAEDTVAIAADTGEAGSVLASV